ncbi:peptide ABC transporter permease [Labrys miyagiensis]|uniref:Peptide ABC transporter permease n=1 Tax=Labrys miyagiensis TaxID=346912 RepID=A0ABQ6CPE0_9HYPH|nr:ABC transporter permease [Labrys miyagiensis]GLS22226.1 peptide ABC transporter permease [Labrys miyagiensis]
MRFGRFILVRLALLVLTLWLVSAAIFIGAQVLPGDVGRTLLGPLADAQAVAAINHQYGTDRPVFVQYWDWLSQALQGDFGTSLALRAPVAPFVIEALRNSAALAGVALLLVVPIGIGAGVWSGLRAGSLTDRLIILTSVSAAIVPDFVTALVLLMILALWLGWFPITGVAPDGSGLWAGIYYLILPALPLVLIYTGYIARMARAGMVEALGADYTRTAILKGLRTRTVLLRHVLRNALMPTITVIATQIGYLLGGLVVIESLFHIQGLGNLVLSAAKAHDFPMLEAGVMVMAAVYAIGAAVGDLLQAVLDPRLRRSGAL